MRSNPWKSRMNKTQFIPPELFSSRLVHLPALLGLGRCCHRFAPKGVIRRVETERPEELHVRCTLGRVET
jgi:hypothetical protein